ncbi:MAG TPA: regulatory iron-sulfur-containing complex subunit RicT [Bacteroidales bacterium]|nr:hypothetical protein [Bacteroidales bacterium]HCI55479.1 hypothetical protein [Bacteroidales bacterium]HRC89248.1 regulatory iron-sulfur-containing complex subunit RicT [Bacteroidales bacterium]
MTDNDETTLKEGEEQKIPEIRYCPFYNKLESFDWLKKLPPEVLDNEIVEVSFKNTRKGFYHNINNLRLQSGDIVAVEATPGHDIGRVSLTGPLVIEKMKRFRIIPSVDEMKKVYRKAKAVDLQKWEEARQLEIPTMLKARKISESLGLNMKISDVEYQGDKTKAIFYYIADERVDFRQLIKVLAEEFKVRIEMRQIGARQEAGRIGGIGSCGREFCCSLFITNFTSVVTMHAKSQELPLNLQKLAGQCGKLKCCLTYEFDCYVDAQKNFPSQDIPLELTDRTLHYQKMDIHKGIYWYSEEANSNLNMVSVPVERVREIQELNQKGIKPEFILDLKKEEEFVPADLLENDSISRFDKSLPDSEGQNKRSQSNRRKKGRNNNNERKKG